MSRLRFPGHSVVGAVLAAGAVAVAAAMTQRPVARATSPVSVLARFDLTPGSAVQVRLPRALREISGLAVTADGRTFAHADERGVVMEVNVCEGTVEKSFSLGRPPVRADFEGIAIAGERFFLITSTGQLFETKEAANSGTAPFTIIDTGFGKICELEGLAWNSADRTLVTGCKQSKAPALRGRVGFLKWSVDRKAAAATPSLTMSLADVIRGTASRSFRPSAIERHAPSGNYIAIAGPERAMVEFTAAGAVVTSQPLNRQLHGQPEGLALVGDSLLVIGDEGGNGPGTLTCYRLKR